MEKVSAGKKLYEQVVERVNDMIARGLYKKDDLLPSEKELMEMMGVSRVTVREALRLLGEAGVIRTQKGKGSYVLVDASQFSGHEDVLTAYPKAFMESTDLRILLEPAVARRVATCASEEERRAIGDYLDDFDRELEDFHMSIILAAHNGMLTETFRKVINTENMPSILTLVPPFRQKSVAAKLQHQHERIYEAIRDGNGEFAYFYMLEHLQFVKATYEEFFRVFYQSGGEKCDP